MMAAEQKILLALLIAALCATLALYILKAKKQVAYKGDERWEMVQVRANNAANAVNLVLLALLIALPFVAAAVYLLSFLLSVRIFRMRLP